MVYTTYVGDDHVMTAMFLHRYGVVAKAMKRIARQRRRLYATLRRGRTGLEARVLMGARVHHKWVAFLNALKMKARAFYDTEAATAITCYMNDLICGYPFTWAEDIRSITMQRSVSNDVRWWYVLRICLRQGSAASRLINDVYHIL